MERLVSALLTTARGEVAKVNGKKVDLKKLVDAVLHRFAKQIKTKQIKVQKDWSRNKSYLVHGDENSLYELLSIFMDNAVKYNSVKGKINIRIQKPETGIELTVEDTGVGIPEKDLEHIFDRFYRSDNTTEQGHGLGLSIAKELADQQRVELAIQSEPDQGTTVSLKF
jgi:signal transduction histidine kinase